MTQLNHPPYDEVFFRWLVIYVLYVALGLKTHCVLLRFLHFLQYKKKKMLFFFLNCCCFFRLQPIAAQWGSSRLLPWQLPVNIPAEFPRRQGESTTFLLQKINWTFLQKISKLCVEVGTVAPYLHMFEFELHSDLIDLDLSFREAETRRMWLIADRNVIMVMWALLGRSFS